MRTAITILVSATVLSACAGGYRPTYQIREILVVNNTSQIVRDVSIQSGDRVFACGNIPASRFCSSKFPRRNYDYAPIKIEWALGRNAPRNESLTVDVPLTFTPGLPLRGILEINADDSIEAYFEQETPIR